MNNFNPAKQALENFFHKTNKTIGLLCKLRTILPKMLTF